VEVIAGIVCFNSKQEVICGDYVSKMRRNNDLVSLLDWTKCMRLAGINYIIIIQKLFVVIM